MPEHENETNRPETEQDAKAEPVHNGENDLNRRKNQSAVLKRRMLIVFACIAGSMLLMVFLLTQIENSRNNPSAGADSETRKIHFSSEMVTDEAEFLKDDVYFEYDRNIYLYDAQSGIKESLDESKIADRGACVVFLVDFIHKIIAGDVEGYNECFSERYYEDHDPKEFFTMQKLYNIQISEYSSSDESENGEIYHKYIYTLEYMIRRNNGTLRPDMGSDGIRAQAIVITDREGELLIDTISP